MKSIVRQNEPHVAFAFMKEGYCEMFKGNDVVIDTDILQRAHYNFSCFFDMLFD